MSVNAILTNSSQPTQPVAQSSGQKSKSNADWLASLAGATGSTASTQLSDQMQALLNQLQAGNTVAPAAGAASTTATSAIAGSSSSAANTHHHHHSNVTGSSGSDNGSGLGVLQDIATNLAGNSASASGSGSDTLFGNSGMLDSLQTLGQTASTGVGTAIQAYAAIHGGQFAQLSTVV